MMKLDHTFIAIRERSILEICDLSLHVVRDHIKPLVVLLLIGAAPWIAIDWWLTEWFISDIYASDFGQFYYWIVALLVASQAQVGTTLLTKYLGDAMFVGRPGILATIRGTFRTPFFFVWIHGVIRLVLPILFLVYLSKHAVVDTVYGLGMLVIPGLVLLALLIRAFRPFVTEIIVLERPPVKTRDPQKITFSRRSKSLHGAAGSELFGRFMVLLLFLVPLTLVFFFVFVMIDSKLNLQAGSEVSLVPYYWVAALWLASGFAAVVRFLSYIDIRIRQEGWAVELKMRAEGARLEHAIR